MAMAAENPDQITYFAATNARGKETPFGIRSEDRARHMYIIGKTGMGKSTMLENMAIQDIRNGEGIAFLDPHGSTADRIMEYVPPHRIKDVVYFAPFDMEHPVAFNVMEDVGYDKRHLVVSGLLSAFRKIWVDAWSARMEYILSNTLLALLEYDGATLLDVNRMLINKHFRKKVVDNVKDPIVKSFWVDEFANYTDRYTQDATPAIQNKVGQFTSNPLIRNIVGQPKSSFDIRELMDQKKILIMNLSNGRVGEVNTNLLGSMLVTKIYLAAMSRADVPANVMRELPPFHLYVDEFQNFANESFSDILSEARKYKLRLIIAHQYVEQMEEEVRDAVFGNVGTTVAFRVGPFDAETLEPIFAPQFEATDLVNLGFAQIYLTLMIRGVGSPPFSATTLPPFDPPPSRHVEEVIASSRLVYGKPRAQIEKMIDEWQSSDPPPELSKPGYEYNADGSRRKPPASKSTSSARTSGAAVPAPSKVLGSPRPASLIQESQARPDRLPAQAPPPSAPAASSPVPPVVEKPRPVQPPRQEEPRMREEQPMPPPQPQHFRPTKPRAATPEPPPLEGPKSLKEALAQVTKAPKAPAPSRAPELKEALKRVAPSTPASSLTAEAPLGKKDDISPQVLQAMLAVEEPDESL